MIDLSSWMNLFLQALNERFGARAWFVGLQGSYGRGEATEKSDIGDTSILWFALTLLSVCGLCILRMSEKKRTVHA